MSHPNTLRMLLRQLLYLNVTHLHLTTQPLCPANCRGYPNWKGIESQINRQSSKPIARTTDVSYNVV